MACQGVLIFLFLFVFLPPARVKVLSFVSLGVCVTAGRDSPVKRESFQWPWEGTVPSFIPQGKISSHQNTSLRFPGGWSELLTLESLNFFPICTHAWVDRKRGWDGFQWPAADSWRVKKNKSCAVKSQKVSLNQRGHMYPEKWRPTFGSHRQTFHFSTIASLWG